MNPVSDVTPAMARKPLSQELQARARRIETELFRRMRELGQAPIAEVCDVDVSTVSRLTGESKFGIAQFSRMMALLGLKAVPIEMKCYRPEEIEPYFQLAQQHMRRVNSVHDLSDDDPE